MDLINGLYCTLPPPAAPPEEEGADRHQILLEFLKGNGGSNPARNSMGHCALNHFKGEVRNGGIRGSFPYLLLLM